MESFWNGLIGSTLAGAMALLGFIPAFFVKGISEKLYSAFLGFSAGVMVAASFFSLILPALEHSSLSLILLAILAGGIFVHGADVLLPHEHFLKGYEGPHARRLRGMMLLFLAMTIHNFPEGMAVGVAFQEGFRNGLVVAMGIGLQNIPEGMAVALPARGIGYSRWKAFLLTLISAAVEPLGGAAGAGLAMIFKPVLPLLMAFAAGSMLFVVSDEMIPESHGSGKERLATFSFLIGLILMMGLDVALS